jgi:hypothetical protein
MKKILVSRHKIINRTFPSAGQNIVVIFVPASASRSFRRLHDILGRLGDQRQRVFSFLFWRCKLLGKDASEFVKNEDR